MNETTTGILLSGLMGFFGGLITIPIHALFHYLMKREEQDYSQKLEMIAKQRELLLQHKLEMERRSKDKLINQISKRIENVEKHIGHE
jgi:ABC-type oligopeptide transport system ATPase subunit